MLASFYLLYQINNVYKIKSPAARYFVLTDIFATTVLNFCVRDGNRCVHRAIATRLFYKRNYSLKTEYYHMLAFLLIIKLKFYFWDSIKNLKKLSPRPISISQLNISLCLHF